MVLQGSAKCGHLLNNFLGGKIGATTAIYSYSTQRCPLTFLALQRHPGLQIVHLHLEPLERQVVLVGLAPVGQQDDHDDDEEQASAGRDAEDGWQGEQAVGTDVNFSRRDVEAAHLDLQRSVLSGLLHEGNPTTDYSFKSNLIASSTILFYKKPLIVRKIE